MGNIFISHRGIDAQQEELLASELRTSRHQVWLDEWEIDLGDSIIERINEGLEGTTYVVICYSSAGINSPWMSREWMSSLARQLNGCNIRLLPVLLTGGSPPAILADVKYADLVKDWSKGVSELFRSN
ncbi:MAG: toll/interleukin-1 receptor domain-containing protein [Pyrinomonadaceae bacterium]